MLPLRAPARARRTVGAAIVVVLAASLMTVGGVTTAAAERSDRAPGSGADAPLLERPLRGPAALRRLADGELAEAARRNERSTEALREILADPTSGLGTSGRVFYAEPAPEARETDARTSTETSTTTTAASYPLSETFRLHSRPGAARTVYIDLDGHTVSGVAWNEDGWPSAFYPGFVDSQSTATDAQRRVVQDVWRRVAEDFAPFDINVTTQDPGAAALERTSALDTTYGMRALVVDSRKSAIVQNAVSSFPCYGCAGIAFMNTWGSPTGTFLQPVLIFSDRVYDDAWQIAETVTHEVGHSFDLAHDGLEDSTGTITQHYYYGHGPWSPIMGAGSRGLTQWSSGQYAGASETQDDLGMIRSRPVRDPATGLWIRAGAPVVADDHGGAPTSATPLGAGSTLTASGLISTSTDRDVFAVTRDCTDPLRVTATPAPTGPNLDIALRVLDPDEVTLARRNPTASQDDTVWPRAVSGLGASISVSEPRKGTHYIEVRGGAQGTASTGWTRYASLGSYRLRVETCADDSETSEPVVSPPGRPSPLRVRRGPLGGPRTLVVRWGTAEDRGTPVTGYVVRARKVKDGTVVKTARRTLGPGARRSVWRLKPGRYRFMVRATSAAGPGLRTKWSRAKRPR